MNDSAANHHIWEQVYAAGRSYLWYPSEALVRLVRLHEQHEGFNGVIYDHGCGSGNVAEFLVRSGHKVICADVSPTALARAANRFVGACLPAPRFMSIDPGRPLAEQLPAYDHVTAWQSVYYNTLAGAKRDFADMIAALPRGGAFFAAVATPNDILASQSEPLPDGSRQLKTDVSGQAGAIVAIPRDMDDFISWCPGVAIRRTAVFGIDMPGDCSEFFAIYGVKS